MGVTSTASKNKYNAKAYDQIPLRVKKGNKELIKSFADKQGLSLNGYIIGLIQKDMQKNGVGFNEVKEGELF